MLIRWAAEKDLPEWYALATEVSQIFQHPGNMGTDPEFASYAQSKVSKYEALTAVDYMSGKNMGFIGFSRAIPNLSKRRTKRFARSAMLSLRQVDRLMLK